jgi:polysaccharide biosynthesis protein PslG
MNQSSRSLAGLLSVVVLGICARAGAAPTEYLGLNTHLPADDVLDAAQDLGVAWVRIDLNWYQVQPASGTTDFSAVDKVIDAAIKRGLKVFPTIGYAPDWDAEADTDGVSNNNVPKTGEYQKFCKTAAARYQGKVTHWGLWNEPNLTTFFDGTRQQWLDRVVVEGVKGIKAGCPTCKVLGPELATIGTSPDAWLKDALKALKTAGLMFDVITWHNYSSFIENKPSWMCWDGDLFANDLDSHRVCLGVSLGLSPREVLVQEGLSSLEVWITETGYTAAVSDTAATTKQVTHYRRVLEEQLKKSWWTNTFFYEIVDDNSISDKWGMAVRSGSSPSYPSSYQLKPVWSFVKKVLQNQPAFGGTGTDCADGLDNDGDKLIDYPKDPGCASASSTSEGKSSDGGVGDGSATKADGRPVGDGHRDARRGERGAISTDGVLGSTDAPPGGLDGPAPSGCSCTLEGGGSTTARGGALWLLLVVLSLRLRPRSRIP